MEFQIRNQDESFDFATYWLWYLGSISFLFGDNFFPFPIKLKKKPNVIHIIKVLRESPEVVYRIILYRLECRFPNIRGHYGLVIELVVSYFATNWNPMVFILHCYSGKLRWLIDSSSHISFNSPVPFFSMIASISSVSLFQVWLNAVFCLEAKTYPTCNSTNTPK